MSIDRDFPPSRQPGITIHAIMIAVTFVSCLVGIWMAANTKINLGFTLYIIFTLLAFLPLPFLAYRLYALLRANYSLSRDKFTITWGLRFEQIPISEVEWVRPNQDLTSSLLLPIIHLPGSVLGTRRQPDLGLVEFLATDVKNLLLIATAQHIFAISPANPVEFLQSIERAVEMGSLAPASVKSVYPVFIVSEAWQNPLVRYLWLAGLFLNIGLLTWVSFMIPSLQNIPIGFQQSGLPLEPVSSVRLILLPIVSIFLFSIGWVAGLYFYRRSKQWTLAYLIWISGLLTSIFFLLAVMFIVTTPV